MEKKFLKKLRDNTPEPLKQVFAPVFRNLLVRNSIFLDTYHSLIERESLSPEQISELQLSKLKNILLHAYQHVPYYRDLFRQVAFDPHGFHSFEQLEVIPFLTRELIRENFDRLISDRKEKGGYYTGNTGGSSGYPLDFLLDYNSMYSENAFIYYYRRKLGYRFDHKLATFRGIDFGDKFWQFSPMYNELIFSPVKTSKLTVHAYVKRINQYKPDYLNGYLSSLWFLAKLMDEYGLKLDFPLKGIFFMSENIDPVQRLFVEEFFNVRSATHYGHSERVVLAREMERDLYAFDPYYGYMESVQEPDGTNSIVGTGFLNYTMPLIRYKTDDACTLRNGWYAIDGKRKGTEGMYGYHGEFLPGSAFDLLNRVYRNITHYQIIQKELGKAELLIVVHKDFNHAEMPAIQKDVDESLRGIMDITIRIVDQLVLSPRGKFQTYITQIKDKPPVA